jgi:GTP cyclohydrolase I
MPVMSDQPPARHVVTWLADLFPETPDVAATVAGSIRANPRRIDGAYADLLDGYRVDPAKVLNVALEVGEGEHRGLVRAFDIQFVSMCGHHFLPFFGTVDITYRPGRYILGLGKLPRLVRCRSRRFQLQEVLVRELAEDLVNFGGALGVSVLSRARHLCICYRGPDDPATVNETTYEIGTLAVDDG